MHQATAAHEPRTEQVRAPRQELRPPDWTQGLFPAGLEPFGGQVWAPADLSWSVRDQGCAARAPAYEPDAEATGRFQRLIGAALEATGGGLPRAPLVLVLGAGGGAATVFPCLGLAPDAKIVATDAGVRLTALHRSLRDRGLDGQVLCALVNPQDLRLAPAAFDLVLGVGLLARQMDPDRVIAGAARTLRPGGRAVFLEPFDGHGLLRLAYEQICREADLRANPLSPPVRKALETMIADTRDRTLPDPHDPQFARRDQKWLFSREAVSGAARAAGFAEASFHTHNDHWTLYRDLAEVQVRVATGLPHAALPDWALEILDAHDRALPPTVKRLLMIEGTIVLTR